MGEGDEGTPDLASAAGEDIGDGRSGWMRRQHGRRRHGRGTSVFGWPIFWLIILFLHCIPGQPGSTPHGSEYQPCFSPFYKNYRQGLVLAGLIFFFHIIPPCGRTTTLTWFLLK
jgi:hypothetical protein